MPYYLLSMQQPAGGELPPNLDEIMREVRVVRDELKAAGAWVFAGGLHGPSASTVLRPSGDEVLLTDGPYAEGKEHVGGLNIIDVADLDAALMWARKLMRAAPLPIEVRPFQDGAEA